MSVGAIDPAHGAQLASVSPALASDQPGVAGANGPPTGGQSMNGSDVNRAARYFIFTTWTTESLHASRLTGKWRFPAADGPEPAVPDGMLQAADALRAARLRNRLARALDVGTEVFALFLDRNSRQLHGCARITGVHPRSSLASGAVAEPCSHASGLRSTIQAATRRIEGASAAGPSHAPELYCSLDSEQKPKMVRKLMEFDSETPTVPGPRSTSPTDRVEEPVWSRITMILDLQWITTHGQRLPLREVASLHDLWPGDPELPLRKAYDGQQLPPAVGAAFLDAWARHHPAPKIDEAGDQSVQVQRFPNAAAGPNPSPWVLRASNLPGDTTLAEMHSSFMPQPGPAALSMTLLPMSPHSALVYYNSEAEMHAALAQHNRAQPRLRPEDPSPQSLTDPEGNIR
ncbi:hypothetical protein MIND_00408400 [Mycena indigotica]|uniref:Uncharacterized protein n=1 Tax=Mycena indigotica TaxID=2126181 RepID=A0A8H6T3J0_9AGAR|nr:uncharacterized protein MIND_00408400 [Mycena indigotica]KAF7310343.1 hypothetical protein MIND_00408400 [Mycena indigotica]